MEYRHILSIIANNLNPRISQSYRNVLSSMNPYDAVPSVLFNVPPPRYLSYPSSDFAKNAQVIVSWASILSYTLGINQVSDELPILRSMSNNQLAASFLGLVLNVIILVLTAISMLLIYSLLMISVESRTFELGILRMVGLHRSGVVQMLIVRTLLFSLHLHLHFFTSFCFFLS